MTTTLEPSFLQACLLIQNFKGADMRRVQGALLFIALGGQDFTAAELPGEVVGDSKHIAGAATGALVAQGLLVVVGRVKSPRENAKGRKLDVLRLAPLKRGTVLTWMRANGLPVPQAGQQMELVETS